MPKLEQIIRDSNGRLKSYFLWPHHLPGGEDRIYPMGRRYPKRLREYKHEPEHKAIYINGVEVGYLIPTVPFLHPDTWRGNGIALELPNAARPGSITPVKQPAAPKPLVAGVPNAKKRKANEALNFGAGLDDLSKTEEMFEVEKQLDFMRYSIEKEGELPFTLQSITSDRGKLSVYLVVKPKKSVVLKRVSTKPITIQNKFNTTKALKLVYRSIE